MREFLKRENTADRLNAVLNDPIVRPWVADASEGVLDLSQTVANDNNILLMGEHGGCLFFKLMPAVYEVHTQVLSSGRGKWTQSLTEACAEWMFTRTDACEIVTRVPEGHIGARAAALRQGMKYEFTRHDECVFRGKKGDVHIHSFRIQDWIPTAHGMKDIGRWFHDQIHEQAATLGIEDPPHDDDENHNHYVGICYEMARHGQVQKAVYFYNRWALVSRHAPIRLISINPPIIKFDIGYLTLRDGKVEVSRDV